MTTFKKLFVALMATMAIGTTSIIAGGDIAPVTEPIVVIEDQTKDFYVGINTVIGSGSDYDKLEWFNRTTVGFDAGYVAFRDGAFSAALEARYSTDAQNFGDAYTASAFIKPAYDFDIVSVYALVGYSTVVGTNGSFGDNDGYAYGAGVSVPFIASTEIFVDYVRNDEIQRDIVTAGVNYKF